MSETPETYSAQKAKAEGVRPFSEEELAEMQRWVSGLTFVQGGLADRIERLLATLDAARAELERKEAEAAALRDAAELGLEEAHLHVAASGGTLNTRFAVETITQVLNSTTAGADLLERVRQLEGQLVELRGLAPIAERAIEYVEETQRELIPGAWHDLEHAVQVYRADHQGTGAAGEGE